MSSTPTMPRSSSTRIASPFLGPAPPNDVDAIGLGIRSSSPAGPTLDLTAVYATSASSTAVPTSSPHAATRGRNRRKSYMVTDGEDHVEAVSSGSCEIGRSAQTVRSRMAPAPATDRRTRSTASSVQRSPSISPSRTASPRSRSPILSFDAEAAERPKTPERDVGTDRDSGVARLRGVVSVDTGLNALSSSSTQAGGVAALDNAARARGINSSAGVATLVGSGVSGSAGLLVASPRKGKARDYGDR
jgi:hypothetical protein